MIPRIAERIEAHERIHHGREDAAQPILAVQPLPDERYRFLDRVTLDRARKQRFEHAADLVESKEHIAKHLAGGILQIIIHLLRRFREKLGYADPARISRLRLERASTNSGTMTARDQYETFSMWNGAHFGMSIASGRIQGVARHGTCSNRARPG